MRVKEDSEKAGLKPSSQNTKIMAFVPITSWQIDVGKLEAEADFIFLGSKITAEGDCSHEIKRHLLLGRKSMTNLDMVWCIGRGPHLQLRQEPQGSSDFRL